MPADPPRDITAIFREGTLIDAAILEAARAALRAHKRDGVPVPVWRNGGTVWVQPEDIVIPGEKDDPSG